MPPKTRSQTRATGRIPPTKTEFIKTELPKRPTTVRHLMDHGFHAIRPCIANHPKEDNDLFPIIKMGPDDTVKYTVRYIGFPAPGTEGHRDAYILLPAAPKETECTAYLKVMKFLGAPADDEWRNISSRLGFRVGPGDALRGHTYARVLVLRLTEVEGQVLFLEV